MSSGGPNLRVGLEVNIFGHEQLRRAQRSLSALGLSIEGVQSALVDVNGRQRRFITGVVQLTGATHELREEQSRQARTAIENATANAQVSTSIRRTASAATQSRRHLRELERQNDRTAAAARRLADAETRAANAAAQRNRVLQNQAVLNAVQRGVASNQRVHALRNQLNQAIAAANVGQSVNTTFANAQAGLANPGLNNGRPMTPAQMMRANQVGINQARRMASGGGGYGRGGWGGGGGGHTGWGGGGRGGWGGGGGGHTGWGGGPGAMAASVARVIAYDSLRRMLTGLYQGFWRVHEVLGQWVVDSVKFSDEIERAKTVFQGIGLIGTKNKDGSSMTISQAEMSSDKGARDNAKQAAASSDKLIKELMKVSALTGSDMKEVIAAGRQLLPDMMNKLTKSGKKNAFLENPDEIIKVITDMVKHASVFKMSDPGGRPLAWQMFSIQEAFAGTSGGSKDKGKEAVKSLRTRQGIKVSDETAIKLSKAVNAGELTKAAAILSDVFERSGQGLTVLSNLLGKTLQPNIDGVINAFSIFGKDFVEYFYKDLVADFYTIRETLTAVISSEKYKQTLGKLSTLFASQFGDIRDTVLTYLQMIYDDPAKLYTALEGPIINMGIALRSLRLGLESIALFVSGMFGGNLGFDNLEDSMKRVKENSYAAGENTARLTNQILGLMDALSPTITLITAIGNIFNIVVDLILLGVSTIYRTAAYIATQASKALPNPIANALGIDKTSYDYEGPIGGVFQERRRENLMKSLESLSRVYYGENTKPVGAQPAKVVPQVTSAPVPIAGGGAMPQVPNMPAAPRVPMMPVSLLAEVKEPKLALSDAAVVKGLQVAKPIQVNPKSVTQNVNMTIGTVQVNANDAISFKDKLLDAGRGNFKGKMGIPGAPMIDVAASRGIDF